MRRLLLLLALAGTAVACARTSMFSRPRPEVRGRALHRVMVVALLGDSTLRRDMERRVARHGVPGRYAFVTSADSAGGPIDATLVIAPGETGADSGWTPPTYDQICTPGLDVTQGCVPIPIVTGGYPVRLPWAQFTATLYDAHTGAVLWTASATANGSQYADATALARSMADRTVHQLLDDEVLR